MPLGMITLAAALAQHNIHTKIYEPKHRILEHKDYQLAAQDILQLNPRIIGFSTWCTSFPGIILLAREIKNIAPEVRLIFGGPQASILPKKTLEQFSFIDYILTGEADLTLPRLIAELENHSPDFYTIEGLCFRNSKGKIILNNGKSNHPRLDDLPLPAYHLIPKQKVLKLDVGRGCPFRCTYCTTNSFFSKKFRMKSVDRIVGEMRHLHTNYGVRNFEFTHDMLTLKKDDVLELCRKLKSLQNEQQTTFTWKCSARIDFVDEEMLQEMADSGCTSIFFGIESGSDFIQKKIKKNLHVPKAATVADICRKTGIDMHASYMIGFPDEKKTDLNRTLENILQLLLKGALVQCSVLALLPGTPLYQNYHDHLKFDGKFSNFSQTVCNEEELQLIKNHPNLFSSFYYLPVKTMSRSSMVFMSLVINKLPHFRNTFYLLRNQISDALNGKNLLNLFLGEYRNKNLKDTESPVELLLAEFLSDYIRQLETCTLPAYVNDVFNYEAYSAILKRLFMNWQLLDQKQDRPQIAGDSKIEINPTWKILQTKYKLERILPKENGWKDDVKNKRKGTYHYLLVATSEIACKRIKITRREKQLFDHLDSMQVCDFLEATKTTADSRFTISWLKSLHRLGVIQISNK